MAVPARRTSKSKKAKRRTHYKINPINLIKCSNCGDMKRMQHICDSCGYYKGKSIIKKNS